MASVYIAARTTKRGRSFHVKYRLDGRYGKIEHAGAFPSMREARLRERLVRDWIAQGLHPRRELQRLVADDLTVEQAGRAWLASRRAIADSTRVLYEQRLERLARDFAGVQARHLTVGDVNRWVDGLGLTAGTTREYVSMLRAVLDHAGVENVARDRRVELPRRDRKLLVPPSAAETLRVLQRVRPDVRPLLVLVEQTGLRVSEACAVQPMSVDRTASRLLVPVSKTGRPRWITVQRWLIELLDPPWPFNRQTVHNVLKTACRDARVTPFGPHMLRHRRASLWSAQGVAPALAAAWLGHSVKTYLDTYTHVVPVGEIEAHRLAALL